MTRSAFIIGVLLIVLSLGVVAWKVFALNAPVVPSEVSGLWHVEVTVTARGTGKRGSVKVALPSSGLGQIIYDEHSAADGLSFSIRKEKEGRTGVWSGNLEDTHRIVYGYRVKMSEREVVLTGEEATRAPPDVVREALDGSARYPVDSSDVSETIERLVLPPDNDPGGRLRTLQAFVANEIATAEGASGDDALITLVQREGTSVGKARLLVTLARAAGIPARIVQGLRLSTGSAPEPVVWTEAYVGQRWVPISPLGEFFAKRPADHLVLRRGDGDLVEASQVAALAHRYRAMPEKLRPDEMSALMLPASEIFAALSLYKLPLAAQGPLKLLLLFPFGALIVAFLRNLVGIPTFGTFMPVILAFAMRGTGFTRGMILVGLVLILAIATRVLLERLRLLIVPRLSVLLCLVVLLITGMTLAGNGLGIRDFFAGLLFPVVILTMLVERMSVVLVEEGAREAAKTTGYSIFAALLIYPLVTSEIVAHIVFGFPELIVTAMGVLMLLGGYTGYRLMELVRFRALADEAAR